MEKLILSEIRKYVNQLVLSESTPNLEPEIGVLLGKLGVGAELIIKDLRAKFPTDALLNTSDVAGVKLSRFISMGGNRMATVLEICLSKGLINSGELFNIIKTSVPELVPKMERLFLQGADAEFMKQQFSPILGKFPTSVQDELISSVERNVKSKSPSVVNVAPKVKPSYQESYFSSVIPEDIKSFITKRPTIRVTQDTFNTLRSADLQLKNIKNDINRLAVNQNGSIKSRFITEYSVMERISNNINGARVNGILNVKNVFEDLYKISFELDELGVSLSSRKSNQGFVDKVLSSFKSPKASPEQMLKYDIQNLSNDVKFYISLIKSITGAK